MKIITILKQVPDAEARVTASSGTVDLGGVTFVMDGMDEYGVEEAIRLREAGNEVEIVAVSVGPERSEEAIRTALALGADRAIHVVTDVDLDPITQAKVYSGIVNEEQADLVFVGGKQADWDSAALGPALAETLGWPHADWTTKFAVDNGSVTVTHDIDAGSEDLTMPLPAVITTQQGLNEPRYPTLPNIMKAKRKELKSVDLDSLGSFTSLTTVENQEIQTSARRQTMLVGDAASAAAELVDKLRNEAKVL